MTSTRRFYVPTCYVPSYRDKKFEFVNDKDVQKSHSLKECTPEEFKKQAVVAAGELRRLPYLYLFQDLEKAQAYVEKTQISHEDQTFTERRIIVELQVDVSLEKPQLLMLATDKKQHEHGFNEYDNRGMRTPTGKVFNVGRITNSPENYVIHCVFLKNSNIPFPAVAPKTYQSFFNNRGQIQYRAASLFEDYYNPQFFSFHWDRHYKKQAQQISQDLYACNTAQDAYHYLFQIRKQLIKENPKVNFQGSFMRRMAYALSQLNKAIEEAVAKEAVETTQNSLDRNATFIEVTNEPPSLSRGSAARS